MADLATTIEAAANRPLSASVDGLNVNSRPITDLIAAQNYLDARAAVRKRRRGVVYSRLITPGTVDDCGVTGSFGTQGGLG